MEMKTYTRQEVIDLPVDQLRQMNEEWRKQLKKHYNLWTYELLKRNPRDFDEFLLDQEELKELHFQFRWEAMDWQERLMEKNPKMKKKDLIDYEYSYLPSEEVYYVKDFWDGSEDE